jgi:RNA methyltransferase, TrmH family
VAALARLARQRRARDAEDRFVIDGPVLLADAVRDGVGFEDVFVDPDAGDRADVVAAVAAAVAAGARAWSVTGGLRPHVEVTTPHGVAAVTRRPRPDVAADGGSAALHVVLVGVADPGNVGTLLRTAEAVGATSLVIGEGTADPWAPKVVRASAGSVWRVPLRSGPIAESLDDHADQGVQRVGTSGTDGIAPHRLDLTGPVALVLGSEAHGLPADLAGSIDTWASLPMEGAVESLNVAVAGSVLAFEVVRQRAAAAETAP